MHRPYTFHDGPPGVMPSVLLLVIPHIHTPTLTNNPGNIGSMPNG
jgi:hypothetical protein